MSPGTGKKEGRAWGRSARPFMAGQLAAGRKILPEGRCEDRLRWLRRRGFRTSSPGVQLHGHSSSVCSASSTRSVSAGLRPTLRPLTVTCWMTLSGSTMKVARKATPSSRSRMPSASASSFLLSAIHGKSALASCSSERRHAKWTCAVSVEAPIRTASRSSKSLLQLAIADDLGRADEGEVLRPVEEDLPLAVGLAEIDRLAGRQRGRALLDGKLEGGKLVTNGQHALNLLLLCTAANSCAGASRVLASIVQVHYSRQTDWNFRLR